MFKVTLACLGEMGENWVLKKYREAMEQKRSVLCLQCLTDMSSSSLALSILP